MFVSRRAFGLGGVAFAVTRTAFSRGRSPVGGRVQLRVPWPVATLDPHRLDDVTCAIFGGSVFDSLYAIDGNRVVPALAESMPEPDGTHARVKLRAGLTTASGRPVIAREVDRVAVARAGRGWSRVARGRSDPEAHRRSHAAVRAVGREQARHAARFAALRDRAGVVRDGSTRRDGRVHRIA